MTTPDTADVDAQLAQRAQTSGDYLAGIIAAAMLDTVGQPAKLAQLLWPDTDPDTVQAIWQAGLTTGYRAAKLALQPDPRWTADGLDRLRTALHNYEQLQALTARSASTLRPATLDPGVLWHPADDEQPGMHDGGHP